MPMNNNTSHPLNPSDFNLFEGALCTFDGNYRNIYSNISRCWPTAKILKKIKRGEYFIFLELNLEKVDGIRNITFHKNDYVKIIKNLRKENKVLSVSADSMFSAFKTVKYKPNDECYAGSMKIVYNDVFGWVNINSMTKNKILKQFMVSTKELGFGNV